MAAEPWAELPLNRVGGALVSRRPLRLQSGVLHWGGYQSIIPAIAGQTGLPLGCALVPLVTRDPAYPDDKLNRVIITGQVAAAGRTSGLVASLLLPFIGRGMITTLLLRLQRHLNNDCWNPAFIRNRESAQAHTNHRKSD